MEWKKPKCEISFYSNIQDLSRLCVFAKELSSLVKLELKVSYNENAVLVICRAVFNK